MKYTSRGLKRRGDSDKWCVTLSHKGPITGELVPSYHTVTARTEKQAMKRRDELILDLEHKGGAYTSKLTLAEFLDQFIQYKQDVMAVERSTVNEYRKEARVTCRYIGEKRLADVDIPTVNRWMAQMVEEGYAPRTVAKAFAMLRQTLKHAVALDLVSKRRNPSTSGTTASRSSTISIPTRFRTPRWPSAPTKPIW